MDFSDWKTKVMARLVKLSAEAKSEKERQDLTELILNLKDLRRRDVSSWLVKLYAYCVNYSKMDLCREAAEELEKTEED